MLRRFSLILILASASLVSTAQGQLPKLSSARLGDIGFGTTVSAFEAQLGRKLKLQDTSDTRNASTLTCGQLVIDGVDGFILHIEQGKVVAATITAPGIQTISGLTVGDKESSAIAKYQRDRSYERAPSRSSDPSDPDATFEIVLGSRAFNTRTNRFDGFAVKFSSQRGKIKYIDAGQSSFVLLDEHEDDC